MLFHEPVHQLMKHARIMDITETDPVSKAISLLDQHDISALPVRNASGQKYVGVLSKSDIASRRFLQQLEKKRSPANIPVKDLMNHSQPLFVMEDDTVQAAIDLMHRCHIHRLFVADKNGQLTGVISTSDILRLLVLKKSAACR